MSRLALAALAIVACVRPADDRARLDDEVGVGQAGGARIETGDGLAHLRSLEDGTVALWAQAPAFSIDLDIGGGGTSVWTFEVENCMPDAEIVADAPATVSVLESERPTMCRFEVDASSTPATRIRVGPADSADAERFQFAVMGDIQTALDRVDDVFDVLNADTSLRFIVMTGDIVDASVTDDYDLWLDKITQSRVPVFSTIGNHELDGEPELWHDLFGLYSIHFEFKGLAYTFVDSGNASLDPIVYQRLDRWLDRAADQIHIFGTHYPPLDPVGSRHGEFRSRREASKLLSRLAQGRVDATFYGHIHSFYTYTNAGIPAYISGGGGAFPERLDGIGRHFLKVDADPSRGTLEVSVVRVD